MKTRDQYLEIARKCGQRLSLWQEVAFLGIEGRRLENRRQRKAFHQMTGVWFGQPNPAGYSTVVIPAGRRSGKTSIASILATSALLRDWSSVLAAGETARVLGLATTLEQNRQLIDFVAGNLDAMGVQYERREREIEVGRNLLIAMPSSLAGTKSGTSVLVICDELATWPTDEGSEGRDVDVLASVRPTLATTHGRLIIVSSPWAMEGELFRLTRKYEGKIKSDTLVLQGPTWCWNDSISEQRTHELESDPSVWAREFKGLFGSNSDAFLQRRDIAASTAVGITERAALNGIQYCIGFDRGGRGDPSVAVVAHREYRKRVGGPPLDLVVVDAIRIWEVQPGNDFDQCMRELAVLSRRYNAIVHRDNFSGDAIEASLGPRGVTTLEVKMGSADQQVRWEFLAHKIRTHSVVLLDNERCNRELADLRIKLKSAGRVDIAAPAKRSHHDDVADALNIAVQIAAKLMPGGGDIEQRLIVDRNDSNWGMHTEWFDLTKDAHGNVTGERPCDPPPDTIAHRELWQERNARGIYETDSDGRPVDVLSEEHASGQPTEAAAVAAGYRHPHQDEWDEWDRDPTNPNAKINRSSPTMKEAWDAHESDPTRPSAGPTRQEAIDRWENDPRIPGNSINRKVRN